jgi:hypothetical protein
MPAKQNMFNRPLFFSTFPAGFTRRLPGGEIAVFLKKEPHIALPFPAVSFYFIFLTLFAAAAAFYIENALPRMLSVYCFHWAVKASFAKALVIITLLMLISAKTGSPDSADSGFQRGRTENMAKGSFGND